MKYVETDFAGMEARRLRALIVGEGESLQKRDEAMYYLLNEKLIQGLRRKFAPYRNRLEDCFEDVLLDFFLYLRGEDDVPYKKLLRINSEASFEGWVVISFRNFVGRRASTDKLVQKSPAKPDLPDLQNVEPIPLDRLINMMSTLVAYCCQELKPASRFIFLRMLLSMLDKSRALPDKEVAASLGITDVYYRVISCRIRIKVQTVKEMLLTGAHMTLAAESRRLADKLNDNFSNWYQILAGCYETTLNALPQSMAISAIRTNHSSPDSSLLYDTAAVSYGMGAPRALWNAFCILREPLA